jgi:FAD:protein FMN transferase
LRDHLSWEGRLLRRRTFLKLSGLLGVSATSGLIAPTGAEALKFDEKNHRVSETRLAIGTIVSMTVIHPSRDQAEEAMGLAFEEIERLSGLMNRFLGSTAVSHLNQEGRIKDTPPEMQLVLEKCIYYHGITGGAFDITVKPVIDLFQEKYVKGKPIEPTEAELKKLLGLVDAGKIELTGRSVSFGMHGMGITLDGIAKGYIVDKASGVLLKHGISNHLVNAGGDIRTSGSAEEGKPWTIAVQDPFQKKEFPEIIRMRDGAVATSGNYEVYYDREKVFHHIVNPRTGHSPALCASVSIQAKTAMEADALSTSAFVMDPIPGTRLIDSLPDCHSFIIEKTGKVTRSQGWRSDAANA